MGSFCRDDVDWLAGYRTRCSRGATGTNDALLSAPLLQMVQTEWLHITPNIDALGTVISFLFGAIVMHICSWGFKYISPIAKAVINEEKKRFAA